MTYETKEQVIAETAKEERIHFTQCSGCGKWYDMRSFDDMSFHNFGHREAPDFNIPQGTMVRPPFINPFKDDLSPS